MKRSCIDRRTILTGAAAAIPAATLPTFDVVAQQASSSPRSVEPLSLPVSAARNGFTPAQAADLLARYNYQEVLKGDDVALYYFLNIGQRTPVATIAREGDVVMLEKALDPKVGQTKGKGEFGELSLSEFLADPRSRAQGMIVVRNGRVVFEEYPGMRPTDYHVWMSIGKTAASLVVALLAEQGKIDVSKLIDAYLPALRSTQWSGTSVQDVLDMASGMDVVETADNRANPRSVIARFNLAVNAAPNADGKVERQVEVITSAPRSGRPGQAFDYSSVNTVVLGLLAEAVENKRWPDILQERVWSKMTVEGDMQLGVSPDGVAQAEGLYMTRLRDLARYEMLYTPSWNKAAHERIVSDSYLQRIQAGGRKDIFLKGELGNRLVNKYFTASPPVANSWQWDGVFADGDFFKSGSYGQGLYVSPSKDLVIAWHSTILYNDLTHYARAIATSTRTPSLGRALQ